MRTISAGLAPGEPGPPDSWAARFLSQANGRVATVLDPNVIRPQEVQGLVGVRGVRISSQTMGPAEVAAYKAEWVARTQPSANRSFDAITNASEGFKAMALAFCVLRHTMGEFYGANYGGKGEPAGRPAYAPAASTAAIAEGLREHAFRYTNRWETDAKIIGRMGAPTPVPIVFEVFMAEGWRGHVSPTETRSSVSSRISLAAPTYKCGFPSDGAKYVKAADGTYLEYPDTPGWFANMGGNLCFVRRDIHSAALAIIEGLLRSGMYRIR